ncbi:N-terminal glutamine amidase-domain-containing protein [Thamnidium elegans]|nr:N-terminal glutamine amidase-domain-containing protein [Thamnidium elegans]
MLNVKKFNLTYTRCYCEENIYLLCKEIEEKQNETLEHCSVVYISNDDRMVPLWKQKAGVGQQPVVWDYHVILYVDGTEDNEAMIYDYDTTLSFPCSAQEYIIETFKPEYKLKKKFDRYFRFVGAKTYLEQFSSDRSHMMKKDGTYYAEPPLYPPIKSNQNPNNLFDFISMKENEYGTVYSTSEFYCL